jgi:hypothetical protein
MNSRRRIGTPKSGNGILSAYDRIRSALVFAREHLSEPSSVERLAERQFSRVLHSNARPATADIAWYSAEDEFVRVTVRESRPKTRFYQGRSKG